MEDESENGDARERESALRWCQAQKDELCGQIGQLEEQLHGMREQIPGLLAAAVRWKEDLAAALPLAPRAHGELSSAISSLADELRPVRADRAEARQLGARICDERTGRVGLSLTPLVFPHVRVPAPPSGEEIDTDALFQRLHAVLIRLRQPPETSEERIRLAWKAAGKLKKAVDARAYLGPEGEETEVPASVRRASLEGEVASLKAQVARVERDVMDRTWDLEQARSRSVGNCEAQTESRMAIARGAREAEFAELERQARVLEARVNRTAAEWDDEGRAMVDALRAEYESRRGEMAELLEEERNKGREADAQHLAARDDFRELVGRLKRAHAGPPENG